MKGESGEPSGVCRCGVVWDEERDVRVAAEGGGEEVHGCTLRDVRVRACVHVRCTGRNGDEGPGPGWLPRSPPHAHLSPAATDGVANP
jgi:hypothetical protein